jgi:hypothetical protein
MMSGYLENGYAVFKKGRLKEVRCKVRCRGKMHTIVRTTKGQLVLCDHNLKREMNFVELGGRESESRCMEIFRLWRGNTWPGREDRHRTPFMGATTKIPTALRDAYSTRYCDQMVRYEAEKGHRDWLEVTPFFDRHDRKTQEAVRKALYACPYNMRGADVTVTVCLRRGNWHHNVRAEGDQAGQNLSIAKSQAWKWFLLVPREWYYDVYLRGFAVIDGHFVFRVVKPGAVLVLRQAPNGDPTVCGASVSPEGKLHFAPPFSEYLSEHLP